MEKRVTESELIDAVRKVSLRAEAAEAEVGRVKGRLVDLRNKLEAEVSQLKDYLRMANTERDEALDEVARLKAIVDGHSPLTPRGQMMLSEALVERDALKAELEKEKAMYASAQSAREALHAARDALRQQLAEAKADAKEQSEFRLHYHREWLELRARIEALAANRMLGSDGYLVTADVLRALLQKEPECCKECGKPK